MRLATAVGVSLTVLVGSGWADEIYRWTDAGGRVHYSNTPTTGGTPTGLATDETPAETGGEDAAVAPDDDGGVFSTDASLRRNAIEREARSTERRLRDLDDHLASLARARMANAAGSVATGGVVTLAGDVRSEEERVLAEERAQLAERAQNLQGEYGKLRDEVTTRFGTTPAWWVDLRPGRR